MICPPDHKHGETTTCYGEHKCECEPCRESKRKATERYRKLRAYGRPTTDMIGAQPVREHLNRLRENGFGQDRIAELSGVQRSVIRHVLWGTNSAPAKRIRRANAEALLAVQPDPDVRFLRDPKGVRRRIQALAHQGWSLAKQAHYLGVTTGCVHGYLEVDHVSENTLGRVSAMFNELWDKRPPLESKGDRISYAQTVAHARRNGWVGPLGWDDIDNDEVPPEVPKATRAAVRAHREAEIERLHSYRYGDKRIARELGMHPREVFRIRQGLGLLGWSREKQKEAA